MLLLLLHKHVVVTIIRDKYNTAHKKLFLIKLLRENQMRLQKPYMIKLIIGLILLIGVSYAILTVEHHQVPIASTVDKCRIKTLNH